MSLRYMSRMVVRAIQGMKEQSSKGTILSGFKSSSSSQARPRSDSGQFRWVSGAKKVTMDEKSRIRKAEKAENVMHLVCWGPN